MRRIFALLLLASPAWAEPYNIDREKATADYEVNKEEMSVARAVMDILAGEVTPHNCAYGYLLFKAGNYDYTEEVFTQCAEAGIAGAMTWLSYGYKNGLGMPKDFEKMAYWDKRAADAGDAAGMFNYGIDLIRGQGVAKNEQAGQGWIDKAAAHGFEDALKLQNANYTLPEYF